MASCLTLYLIQNFKFDELKKFPFAQRIAGSDVKAGLKFFGMSISQSSYDHSEDNLPDLAVGSKGTVVLLR